ncbi:MAG: MMPL family transporter [Thermoplasmata archaeon]|nr:MAG: MMPL family transporter [Thermoplasmata archaeon]
MKKEKLKKTNDSDVGRRNPLTVLVGISAGHPKKTLLVALIVTIIFMALAANLKIDSSVEGVFGDDVPEEIEDFMEVGEEFGEQELVTVVVDCENSNETNARMFLKDLAPVLKGTEWFRDIQYTQNMDFAGEKTILYVPEEYLYFVMDPNATSESVEMTHQYIISSMNEPQYFVSENGNIYILNMILNNTIDDVDERAEIFDGLYELLEEVQDSDSQYDDLKVGFTGSMTVMDYEADKMALNDMYLTGIVTFILILIILFISFKSISLPLLSLVPLLMGIVITAGIIAVIYGALSMLAAVFAVLLLGLGIDFSIHILTRFTEELNGHEDIKVAFKHTSLSTGKAIVLGTMTTAVAFGALAFSNTSGMRQMGVVLAIGLITTMLCVFAVLPALITLRLRRGKLRQKLSKRAKYNVLKKIGSGSARFASVIILILLVVGVFLALQVPATSIDENLHELQPKTTNSYKQLEKVKENFNYTEDYILCVANGYDELVYTADGYSQIPEIMEVESILSFLPENQTAKLAILAQAKAQNPGLESVSWMNLNEMTWQELPESIKMNWVSEGPEGERFLIRVSAWGNIWDKDYRETLVPQMEEVNPNIVARAIMFPVLMDAMTQDVINVTFYAGIPIFLIVFIGFKRKNPVYALLALVPVAIGIGGVLALAEFLDISLNMISIMMIPLVVGIGIDDGIHILHRYKEEGKGSIPHVVQNTGKAVFLTTVTTCLAFSSFTVAQHPGMRALGQVPVLGLVLALIGALIFLPALIVKILDRTSVKTSEPQVSPSPDQ